MNKSRSTVPQMKIVSRQHENIYKLLLKSGSLTANEIAEKLDILPNAVYRAANKLVELGLIQKAGSYPVSYKANKVNTAMNWYLLGVAQNFRNEFGQEDKKLSKKPVTSISLIKDRPTMLKRGAEDARNARKSIDFIVSGHEVPDETILAYRKAITIGVNVRGIIHQEGQAESKQTEEWKRIGAKMRYLPDFNMRMIVYDRRIVYITSYDANDHRKAFGVRFEYPPLALQMSELFEQNWQKASKL